MFYKIFTGFHSLSTAYPQTNREGLVPPGLVNLSKDEIICRNEDQIVACLDVYLVE